MQQIMMILCEDDGLRTVKLHGLRMLAPAILEHILSSADSAMVARNVNRDSKWSGTFAPRTKTARAISLRDRIEDAPWATAWKHFRCEQSPQMDLPLEAVGNMLTNFGGTG